MSSDRKKAHVKVAVSGIVFQLIKPTICPSTPSLKCYRKINFKEMFLFLDIDGVMVPAKGWAKPELLNDGFAAFSDKAVRALQSLIFEDTIIMLTSSHKSNYTIDEWKEIFKKRNILIDKFELLARNIENLDRKNEIEKWFKANQKSAQEDFLIVDDDKSLNALPEHLKKNLILTSPLVGLTMETLKNAKDIPKRFRPRYNY